MEKNTIFKVTLILVGILILSFGIIKIKEATLPGAISTSSSSTTTTFQETTTIQKVKEISEATLPGAISTSSSSTTTTFQETTTIQKVKEISMTAKQWEFIPGTITVNKGDRVKLHIKSIDVTHGFGLPAFGINERLEPEKTVDVEFVADKTGTFAFACTVYCGKGHGGMKGKLIVK